MAGKRAEDLTGAAVAIDASAHNAIQILGSDPEASKATRAACDQTDDLKKRLGEAEGLLWAQRVVWAWAEKHDEATPPAPVYHRYMSKVDGDPLPQWRIQIGTHLVAFAKPDEAVVALAQHLVHQDPGLEPLPDEKDPTT